MENFANALLLETMFRVWAAPYSGAEKNNFVRRHFVERMRALTA